MCTTQISGVSVCNTNFWGQCGRGKSCWHHQPCFSAAPGYAPWIPSWRSSMCLRSEDRWNYLCDFPPREPAKQSKHSETINFLLFGNTVSRWQIANYPSVVCFLQLPILSSDIRWYSWLDFSGGSRPRLLPASFGADHQGDLAVLPSAQSLAQLDVHPKGPKWTTEVLSQLFYGIDSS